MSALYHRKRETNRERNREREICKLLFNVCIRHYIALLGRPIHTCILNTKIPNDNIVTRQISANLFQDVKISYRPLYFGLSGTYHLPHKLGVFSPLPLKSMLICMQVTRGWFVPQTPNSVPSMQASGPVIYTWQPAQDSRFKIQLIFFR